MTHLTLIPLQLTAYRITNRPCCYLFGHILGIYQRNDYGKTIWVRKTYHGHQNMVTYPINLEWVCNTFSNIFYPIFQMNSTFFLLFFALCACTSLVRCAEEPQEGGAEQRPGKEKVSIKISYYHTNKNSQKTLKGCGFTRALSLGQLYWWLLVFRLLPSCPKLLFQSASKCQAIGMIDFWKWPIAQNLPISP